jgi:hypothetical protein
VSDTPETDAELARYQRMRWTSQRKSAVSDLIPADFARDLERQRDKLLDALEHMACHHRCGCGHPACKRCADDRINEEVIASVKGGCR